MRIFDKVCGLVTYELFTLATSVEALPQFYMDDELESMRDQVQNIREQEFLENLFGYRSRLDNKEWQERLVSKVDWVLKPEKLRAMILEIAEIEPIHHESK